MFEPKFSTALLQR